MRIRISIRYKENNVVTVALVNSGYESEVPEIHIPLALARRLGLPLERLRAERYHVVGSETTTYILNYVDVKVITEDRESKWVKARAVSVPGELEVLLGDALIEELGIDIVKPRSGLWRFIDERKLRTSKEIEYWIE